MKTAAHTVLKTLCARGTTVCEHKHSLSTHTRQTCAVCVRKHLLCAHGPMQRRLHLKVGPDLFLSVLLRVRDDESVGWFGAAELNELLALLHEYNAYDTQLYQYATQLFAAALDARARAGPAADAAPVAARPTLLR